MQTIMDQIVACGIVPVIVLRDADKAVPVARALLDGGISVIEVTFRTKAAPQAIRNIRAALPTMLAGAGTILSEGQLAEAMDAGAQFVVSPGLDADLVRAAMVKDCPILPGAVTPSEIMAGLRLGIEVFKFFPAGNYGGLSTIRSLSAPFSGIRFVPTGGVSEKNLAEYLSCPCVTAVGGSWMATPEMIDAGDFDGIRTRTAEAVALLRSIRPL